MCWCTPEKRTPNCGAINCYPPIENYKPKDLIKNHHVRELLDRLEEAHRYLDQGKRKFTPHTTNSYVDLWLKEAPKALKKWESE